MPVIVAFDANIDDPFDSPRVAIPPTATRLIEGVPAEGLYAHYKGGKYSVRASFKLESGRRVVLYRSLQDGREWVRDVGDFLSDARLENDGDPRYVRRFIPLRTSCCADGGEQ